MRYGRPSPAQNPPVASCTQNSILTTCALAHSPTCSASPGPPTTSCPAPRRSHRLALGYQPLPPELRMPGSFTSCSTWLISHPLHVPAPEDGFAGEHTLASSPQSSRRLTRKDTSKSTSSLRKKHSEISLLAPLSNLIPLQTLPYKIQLPPLTSQCK